jgi:hypothetical protein
VKKIIKRQSYRVFAHARVASIMWLASAVGIFPLHEGVCQSSGTPNAVTTVRASTTATAVASKTPAPSTTVAAPPSPTPDDGSSDVPTSCVPCQKHLDDIGWPSDQEALDSRPSALVRAMNRRPPRKLKDLPKNASSRVAAESLSDFLSGVPMPQAFPDGSIRWNLPANTFTMSLDHNRQIASEYTGDVLGEAATMRSLTTFNGDDEGLIGKLLAMPQQRFAALQSMVGQAAEEESSEWKRPDPKKDFCCACIYAPGDRSSAYNGTETRFKTICEAMVKDNSRHDVVTCQDARAFAIRGQAGKSEIDGLAEWTREVIPAKCDSMYIVSERHGNGYYHMLDDIFKPATVCALSGTSVKCVYQFEQSCSGYSFPFSVCHKARELQEKLNEADSNTYFEIVAARDENATPGGSHSVDERFEKITQSNPDGHVKLNHIWRNLVVTRDGFWLYRHVPDANNPKGSWKWVPYTWQELKDFCAGSDKYYPKRSGPDQFCPIKTPYVPPNPGDTTAPPKDDSGPKDDNNPGGNDAVKEKTVTIDLWTDPTVCIPCAQLDQQLPAIIEAAAKEGITVVVNVQGGANASPTQAIPFALVSDGKNKSGGQGPLNIVRKIQEAVRRLGGS